MGRKLTTEIFIERANKKHNFNYNYSKSNYLSIFSPIEIICPIHGSFFQEPHSHLKGSGCPECAHQHWLKKDDFFKMAKKLYNDYYDYSKSIFINSSTLIEIGCPKHGSFFQWPQTHLKGSGCVACYHERITQTLDYFVENATKKHNNYYDYSKCLHKGCNRKVEIICPIHGSFWQTPKHHLNGVGCKKCAHDSVRTDLNQFISKANNIHNNRYDYSKVVYVNAASKVEIICPTHGTFLQRPNQHLQKNGCPKCFGEESRLTTEVFIERANKINNNFYDYSKVNYVLSHTKVEIICPFHGSFFQDASQHLQGNGCPVCTDSKSERLIYKWLIDNNFSFERQFTFSDCRYIKELRFDFCVFVQNRKMLIEYDGIQHFKEVEYWGGKKHLEDVQRNDKIKNDYVNANNLSLLRLKYTLSTEQINNELSQYLLNKKE